MSCVWGVGLKARRGLKCKATVRWWLGEGDLHRGAGQMETSREREHDKIKRYPENLFERICQKADKLSNWKRSKKIQKATGFSLAQTSQRLSWMCGHWMGQVKTMSIQLEELRPAGHQLVLLPLSMQLQGFTFDCATAQCNCSIDLVRLRAEILKVIFHVFDSSRFWSRLRQRLPSWWL